MILQGCMILLTSVFPSHVHRLRIFPASVPCGIRLHHHSVSRIQANVTLARMELNSACPPKLWGVFIYVSGLSHLNTRSIVLLIYWLFLPGERSHIVCELEPWRRFVAFFSLSMLFSFSWLPFAVMIDFQTRRQRVAN